MTIGYPTFTAVAKGTSRVFLKQGGPKWLYVCLNFSSTSLKRIANIFLNNCQILQKAIRWWILESEHLPRSASDLDLIPGTVSGPAKHRTRELVRGAGLIFCRLNNHPYSDSFGPPLPPQGKTVYNSLSLSSRIRHDTHSLNRARGTQKCFSMAIELLIFPNRSEESSLPGLSHLCGLFVPNSPLVGSLPSLLPRAPPKRTHRF